MINRMILIVDDNPQNVQILGKVLDNNGYSVAISLNGIQALEFIENEKVDLILLDIIMPDMDGYEVCKRLKNNEKTKNIPVIFLTAKNDKDDLLKCFKIGAVDYITKPFNHAELLARVNTHVELKIAREKLEKALSEIIQLEGFIPICASCKKIKDDKNYWEEVEVYIRNHSLAEFSHSICPDCAKKLYGKMGSNLE